MGLCLYKSDFSTANPLLSTMTLSKLNTIAPNSNYVPSISILSKCMCLAPIAVLQLLLIHMIIFIQYLLLFLYRFVQLLTRLNFLF